MRIIVNAISANTGGIVTYTTNLIEFVAARDVEVIVYVPRWFDTSKFDGLNVSVRTVRMRFFGPIHRFLWEQTRWRQIIKDSGADIVFSSANYGVLFPPIPQILLVQGEIYLNPVYRERVLPRLSWRERLSAMLRRNLMLISARHSRITVFPSNVAMDAALDYERNLSNNGVVNYLGVSSRFNEPERRRRWREDDTIRLLYVSVYYPHKDPGTLAEATLKLRQRGVAATARITMEGRDFEAWDNAASELAHLRSDALAECIEMGRIEHEALGDVLANFDVFVFPSMAETFGFPMVEAMCAGVPLVVSDIPVHREICGDAAIYFELGNPDDLANKVMQLNDDAALRARLVKAGRARAETQFTWSNHIDGLIAVMSRIADDGRYRILLNALHARSGGGVTYLHNMLPLLAADQDLDVHVCLHEDQRDLLPTNLERVQYHYQRCRRGFWRILFREQVELPRLARRIGAKATFSPANFGPFFLRNHVVLIRNAVSVGFVERRPIKLAYWALLYLATLTSLITCRRAIAVSNYAKRGIEGTFWRFLSRRLVVVPHGVDKTYLGNHADSRRDGRFLLSVSDIYVQKNFIGLIKVVAKLRDEFPDIRLRVAGSPVDEEYFNSLVELIRRERLEEHVEFLGHVAPARLKELYEQCEVFVFPSTVETFGNPLVEAMACGAPIASSNSAAMPEVLGDAAVFFDPNSVDDMTRVLSGLLNDDAGRKALTEKALVRSNMYSWDETKRRTVDVIRDAVANVPG
ncbi:MAG: glycosyltransferase [Rhodospirillaceae bacterium]